MPNTIRHRKDGVMYWQSDNGPYTSDGGTMTWVMPHTEDPFTTIEALGHSCYEVYKGPGQFFRQLVGIRDTKKYTVVKMNYGLDV